MSEFLDNFSQKYGMLSEYNNHEDYFNAFDVEESKLNKKNIKHLVCDKLEGIWFEEIIHEILIELKNENVIDDFASNLSNKSIKNLRESYFEIDFIAMKNYKLYYFSVSTTSGEVLTEFKLYEIKQRARILSEDQSSVTAITFIDNKEDIIKRYMNVWDDKPDNVHIITWNELPKLKEAIAAVIKEDGEKIE